MSWAPADVYSRTLLNNPFTTVECRRIAPLQVSQCLETCIGATTVSSKKFVWKKHRKCQTNRILDFRPTQPVIGSYFLLTDSQRKKVCVLHNVLTVGFKMEDCSFFLALWKLMTKNAGGKDPAKAPVGRKKKPFIGWAGLQLLFFSFKTKQNITIIVWARNSKKVKS